MIKWFAYIVLLLMLTPCLSSAGIKSGHPDFSAGYKFKLTIYNEHVADTATAKKTKQQEQDDKKKIKEIAKARRQPKPEKIDLNGVEEKSKKPKRQRRPEGLEQPPEIPRRNGGG